MELSVRQYSKIDPEHYSLFRATWAPHVDRGQGKMLDPDQLRRFYEENPAGPAVLAVATEGAQWQGAIAGIPTLLDDVDGTVTRAYQIGDFMVHPEAQGKGLGRKLLDALSRELKAMEDPVYTFPNRRSIGLFFRLGYTEVRRLDLLGYSTHLLRSLSGRRARHIETDRLSLSEACEFADTLGKASGSAQRRGRHKDGGFIDWRYARVRTATDYRFLGIRDRERDGGAILVWTPFKYRGVTVQVIVDSVSWSGETSLVGIAAADAVREGVAAGICNLDRGQRRPVGAVTVPKRLDPRPGRLLVPGEDPVSMSLAQQATFTTGDWMGF
ncbi:MAG: GNAT family N-acetyltransferase [Candidatus Eisenbacteria bacterium]|uniref:GNAT family N-acetyltransferase n=1 Tax=Eiseniibacteriota bacterium TaxID=2212470 RepID=A0A956SG83_UNCEI|nr:GNAT family N-acetyltransferase [Candidatus Eisenbacteria bacterium]